MDIGTKGERGNKFEGNQVFKKRLIIRGKKVL